MLYACNFMEMDIINLGPAAKLVIHNVIVFVVDIVRILFLFVTRGDFVHLPDQNRKIIA